jgi:MtN3 and saliva related transmembrane protein
MEIPEHIETIGLLAASLGTISLMPQIIKIWTMRSASEISTIMYLIISACSVLWIIYAIVLSLTPLIIQSAITLTCAIAILIMKAVWK